ncbi:MAG: murein transglycosylase [Nitrosarchaeum sp.]|nr:murein transglycosylase [Nitrosarchaeum sp.]
MKIIVSVLVALLVTNTIIPTFSQSQIINDVDTQPIQNGECSNGWYITGYFLPIETDYSSNSNPIMIDKKWYNFQADFLDEVKIQGWGKTTSGDYLGWDHGKFSLNSIPLDSNGNKLVVGTIAVDPEIIKNGTEISIITLPHPWDEMIFHSKDVGPAIVGKHIDVYTGEGLEARKEAFRITGEDNLVCTINDTNHIQENIKNSNSKKIPDWVKNIFIWYGQDKISEDDVLNAIKFLINQEIIKIK